MHAEEEPMPRTEVIARTDHGMIGRAKELLNEISVPAGTVLTREDAPGFDVFIVVEGTATIGCGGAHLG